MCDFIDDKWVLGCITAVSHNVAITTIYPEVLVAEERQPQKVCQVQLSQASQGEQVPCGAQAAFWYSQSTLYLAAIESHHQQHIYSHI